MTYLLSQTPGSYLPVGAEPKKNADGTQKTNREGVPQWTIHTLYRSDRGDYDTIKVTVAATKPPSIVPMQSVVFAGLRIGVFTGSNGTGVYFQADSVSTTSDGSTR